MIPSLPADFFARMNGFLQPYMSDSDEREAWLTQAFYLREPRLFHQIDRAGSTMVFTTKCIQKLLTFECLANPTEHALATLLKTIRYGVGTKQQLEIDAFVSQLDGLCTDEAPVAKTLEQLSSLPKHPTQSVDTPNTERTPTVFVSYSHDDKVFAERLTADLQAAGHAVWTDVSRLKGGDLWIRAISEGIINSYAFVVLVTRRALASAWVQDEITWAKKRGKLIIPVLLEDVVEENDFFPLARYQALQFYNADYAEALRGLLIGLPPPPSPDINAVDEPPTVTRRALELQYLDRLRFEVLLNTERYTALSGTTQQRDKQSNPVPFALMRPEYTFISQDSERRIETRRFDNAIEELLALGRAVVLGEPGAGKTTTLWKLAHQLAQSAITDERQPVPLVIRLGKWVDEHQPLESFIRSELGALGPHLDELLSEKRAALLLDGLNEIPTAQRSNDSRTGNKTEQVEKFIQLHSFLVTFISCRAQDYATDLALDRVEIAPLDAVRIREFCIRYLGSEDGIALFERLIGGEAAETETEFIAWALQEKLDDPRQIFWLHSTLPSNINWGKENWNWRQWLNRRELPTSLLFLARNPYFLSLLAQVYVANQGQLPENRGELFRYFVIALLIREHIIEVDKQKKPVITTEAIQLLDALARLAYSMQTERSTSNSGNALTSLPLGRVQQYLTQAHIYLASSASLLTIGDTVRFSHQLLQEYFAARYMDDEIRAGRLKASDIWPTHEWWKRTNWEEAAIMLAGFYQSDSTPIVEWLSAANPEVASLCISRSGAFTPDSTKSRLRDRWISILKKTFGREREPLARAAIGRALGLVTIENQPADNRKGVSITVRQNANVPEIDWIDIPAGHYQSDKMAATINKLRIWRRVQGNPIRELSLPQFSISRHLLTFAQFQIFIDDREGFSDQRWWDGLANNSGRHQNQSYAADQAFKFGNHPRDTVSWYDAIAYCRWLSWRLGSSYDLDNISTWAVRLPTVNEWEKSARGKYGRVYPYGNEFDATKSNTQETGIFMTTAVGIFPEGESQYGVMDMSGNVWEWTLTDYTQSNLMATDEILRSDARRVLCGGSWSTSYNLARAVSRISHHPQSRLHHCGFRLCRTSS